VTKHPSPYEGRRASTAPSAYRTQCTSALEPAVLVGWRRPSAVDHRYIGLLQVGTAVLFLALGGVLALLLRAQLAQPDNVLLDGIAYNQVFTMHGSVMVFLFALPVLQGIAVSLLPAMLGARDLPFPRLAAFSYWVYALGGGLFCATLLFGVAPDSGWIPVTPLASYRHSPSVNADLWLAWMALMQVSVLGGVVQVIVATLRTRTPGMSLMRMPIYAWSMMLAAFAAAVAFAPLLIATGLLVLERALHWPFFIPEKGGDPLLFQRLFWLAGAAPAHALFLPLAGMVSMMVPALAGARLVGYGWVVAALVAGAVLAATSWVARVFVGVPPQGLLDVPAAASLAIAVPGAIHLFAWLATFRRGRARLNVPTLFLLGCFFNVSLGVLAGAVVALPPLAGQAQDSYFAVAHLHYLLVGGLMFALVAALYYWAPLAFGRCLSEPAGCTAFVLMFAGMQLAHLPMFVLGLAGMPRRIYTYTAALGWDGWNLVATAGAAILALGVCVVVADLLWHLVRRATGPHRNPWGAPSLEWRQWDGADRQPPRVHSRYPLWDQAVPSGEPLAGPALEEAKCSRVTLVTSACAAQPQYVLALPAASWLPLLTATALAVMAFCLALQLDVLASVAAASALGAAGAWCWRTDRHAPHAAGGLETKHGRPAYGSAARSHSWWAMAVLLAVDAAAFLSLVVAYLRLWLAGEGIWPPLDQALPALSSGAGGVVLWVTSSVLFAYAGSMLGQRRRVLPLLGVALLVNVGALAVVAQGLMAAGLMPHAHAYSAMVSAMLGYQALHGAAVAMMVGYLMLRASAGLLGAHQRSTLENVRLFYHYAVGQGIVAAALLYMFPRLAA
jgi:cytochrome c oxidase subunit I+III